MSNTPQQASNKATVPSKYRDNAIEWVIDQVRTTRDMSANQLSLLFGRLDGKIPADPTELVTLASGPRPALATVQLLDGKIDDADRERLAEAIWTLFTYHGGFNLMQNMRDQGWKMIAPDEALEA